MKIEKIENGLLKLTINKEGTEFETIKKNVLALFKDKKVDGFRPGKVPADVLEKTFAKDIEKEIVNKVVTEEYEKALKNKEVLPISNLVLDKTEYKKDSVLVELSVAVEPEFTMPKYTGLNITEDTAEVTNEEVEAKLNSLAESTKKRIELQDVKAELEHEVSIDFEGFVDGVAFEGGKAENYPLVLGSKSFIDTFEEQIVGHKIGDEFDVNVNFPEEYHAENLKGKPALFKVKVNKIVKFEKPEINDEFAKTQNTESLEELKNNIKEEILKGKKEQAKNKKINDIIVKIVDDTELEPVDILVDDEVKYEIQNIEGQLQRSGMQLQQYLGMINKDINTFVEELKPKAKNNVKTRFVLSNIIKEQKFEVSNEEIEKEFEQVAKNYNMTVEAIKETLNKDKRLESFEQSISNKILNDKLMNFLYSNN